MPAASIRFCQGDRAVRRVSRRRPARLPIPHQAGPRSGSRRPARRSGRPVCIVPSRTERTWGGRLVLCADHATAARTSGMPCEFPSRDLPHRCNPAVPWASISNCAQVAEVRRKPETPSPAQRRFPDASARLTGVPKAGPPGRYGGLTALLRRGPLRPCGHTRRSTEPRVGPPDVPWE